MVVYRYSSDTIEVLSLRASALLTSAPDDPAPTKRNARMRVSNALFKARKNADNDARALARAILLFERVM